MSLSHSTQVARWAQSNASAHQARWLPRHDEPAPVLLTPFAAAAAASVATQTNMGGFVAARAATDSCHGGESSAPTAALETGHSIRHTLLNHPSGF